MSLAQFVSCRIPNALHSQRPVHHVALRSEQEDLVVPDDVRPDVFNVLRPGKDLLLRLRPAPANGVLAAGSEFEFFNQSRFRVTIKPEGGARLTVFALEPYLVRPHDAVILKYLGKDEGYVFIGRPY